MRRPLLILATILMASLPAWSQPEAFLSPRFPLELKVQHSRAPAGSQTALAVEMNVEKPWHVQANPPSMPTLQPTEILFAELPAGISLHGKLRYPPAVREKFGESGELDVYMGPVVFGGYLTVAADAAPGPREIKATLKYQACDDRGICKAPRSMPISFKLEVTAAGTAGAPAPGFPTLPGGPPPTQASTAPPRGPSTGNAPTGAGPRAEDPPVIETNAPADIEGDDAGAGEPGASDDPGEAVPPDPVAAGVDTGAGPDDDDPTGFVPIGAVNASSGGPFNLAETLQKRGLLLTLGVIFLAGLAICMTPCVLPIVPVTVGFFGMQSQGSAGKRIGLAGSYVLGMVLMYAALGVAAGMIGAAFGSLTTHPAFAIGEAVVIGALALSMFGLYELRPPSFIAQKATGRAGYVGAGLMGLMVGIVAAPCAGPVVVGLVAIVSTTKSPLLGMGLFSVLGLGIGLPFMALALFSGLTTALPRSGAWTEMTKRIFGVVMLFAALYLLISAKVVPPEVKDAVMGAFWVGAGMYLVFADPELRERLGVRRFKNVLGTAGVVFGAVWILMNAAPAEVAVRGGWPPATEAALAQARSDGRPVVIDFRIRACAACDELEQLTFPHPEVTQRLTSFAYFQVQADNGDPFNEKLLEEYGVLGFPWVVFLDGNGNRIEDALLMGYEPAAKFAARLDRVLVHSQQAQR